MEHLSKKELREKLAADTAAYLEQHGMIKRPKAASQKKRKRKATRQRQAPKELWRSPPLNSKTSTDRTITASNAEQVTTSRIVCASPGKARQLASRFSNEGVIVQVRNATLILRGSKAQRMVQKSTELQRLLSDGE